MKKNYLNCSPLYYLLLLCLLAFTSCKKDHNVTPTNAAIVPQPIKIGLTEYGSGAYKDIELNISQIGTKSTGLSLLFDTGSGGMVVDANGILPTAMITSSGFNFTGDSTVVNGITITSQKSSIQYGGDNATTTTVYGNLAYAEVTIGNQSGNFTIKRLPFFLYYKGIGSDGKATAAHYFDVIGVSPEYDLTFSNGAYITSPLSYYEPGTGLTKGFKIAALGNTGFTTSGTFVSDGITLGLTNADLTSAGFVMNPLSFVNRYGYSPFLTTNITYNGKSFSTQALFDSGTSPYSLIQDKTVSGSSSVLLPQNTQITLLINNGFSYTYTTGASTNLTQVENPNTTGGNFTIFGIDFFLNNSFLLDYTNHQIGLKNN